MESMGEHPWDGDGDRVGDKDSVQRQRGGWVACSQLASVVQLSATCVPILKYFTQVTKAGRV